MPRVAHVVVFVAITSGVVGLSCSAQTNSVSAPAEDSKPEPISNPVTTVFVLGTIHGEHKTSERFGIEVLKQILRAFDPNVLLTEIPPARWPTALAQHRDGGPITESRVARFPEYTEAFVGLLDELEMDLVPCAAWTETMATDRAAKLAEWKTTRPRDTAAVDEGFAAIDAAIQSLGPSDDPLVIHSDEYDEAVRKGMRIYDSVFGADLGPGGWTAINRAHYALIEAALEKVPPGSRVMISFGAWHKYWFVEKLRQRDDVRVTELGTFWNPTGDTGDTSEGASSP